MKRSRPCGDRPDATASSRAREHGREHLRLAHFGEPVLVLNALTKSFGETQIIRGVDLTVKRGQRHALIGPNGAGKSTLFNLISGHYVPTSGEILLNGESIAGLLPRTSSTGAACRARSRSPTSSRA